MTQNETQEEKMPVFPEPFWRESVDLQSFAPLKEDIEADAIIVGGGITGITAGYLLAKEGRKVVLLESGQLLNGTTGHTTAKVTAQHGLIYDELINHMGNVKAKQYYDANTEALAFIKETVAAEKIDCEFTEDEALIFTLSDNEAQNLENEYLAYQKLGIEGELKDSISLDLPIKKALSMKNQAHFHPLKYLIHLVKGILDNGGQIFENTTAIDVKNEKKPTVITRDGHKATGTFVFACSHFPFYDGKGFYFTRMHAERAYILAVKTERDYPGGMYISAEQPTRSLRPVMINGEKMVLISGESHKTGQGKDTMDHYKALEEYGDELFGIKEVKYRWSAQDLYTLDKVPYIGEITSGNQHVLVATGYKKWGMTTGTAAALLMRDIVLNKDNPYKELFSPSRFYADPSLKKFLVANGDVAKHLIKGKFDSNFKDAEDLSLDEACIIVHKGQRAGAYKDREGCVHIVDTTCTHLGCEIEWNHGDRSWDCPCHGSRFSYLGEVIEGPAKKPLKRIE